MTKASKSKFDSIIDEEISKYIDSLHLEMQEGFNKLRSPAMEKARLTQEMKEGLQFSQLSAYIQEARSFLQTQGQEYLEKAPLQELLGNFLEIPKIIDELSLEDVKDKKFQEIFKVSDASMENIYKIALAKFGEGQYSTSLALFVLLSTLSPSNEGFWLRSGISAQKKEDFDLALSMYKTAKELNPQLLEAQLFSVECYLRKGMGAEAKAAFEQLKLNAENVDDPTWKEVLPQVESIVKES